MLQFHQTYFGKYPILCIRAVKRVSIKDIQCKKNTGEFAAEQHSQATDSVTGKFVPDCVLSSIKFAFVF